MPHTPRRTVGLLGGSFNPAHRGHLQLSAFALKRLGLEEVWWIVSPQNPLKSGAGMAPFTERLACAQVMARHPRIRPSDIETRFGTRFTVDTVERLRQREPRIQFVWLMGADNLAQFHHWHRWRDLAKCVLIGVVDRPGYTYAALASPAAAALRKSRFIGPPHHFKRQSLPAWTFLFGLRDQTSATALREAQPQA